MERNYKQLDQLERDQIAIYRSKGLSFLAIGKILGRSGSTLSREYKRNLNHDGNYLPSEADYQFKRRKKALPSAMKRFIVLSINFMLIGLHYYLENMHHAGIRGWVRRLQREK